MAGYIHLHIANADFSTASHIRIYGLTALEPGYAALMYVWLVGNRYTWSGTNTSLTIGLIFSDFLSEGMDEKNSGR